MITRALGGMLGGMLAVILCALSGGCSALSSPDREYSSNARVLAAIEERLDYRVDRSEFQLTQAEVTDDAITLHYIGVAHPGDQAWVVRFSEKSTELAPERLATLAPALAVIEGDRLQPGFAPNPPVETDVAGIRIEAATYTFRSTLAPAGRSGRGVLAALRRTERGDEVVYQIKLDNHGDRAVLTAADLAPLIAPLASR